MTLSFILDVLSCIQEYPPTSILTRCNHKTADESSYHSPGPQRAARKAKLKMTEEGWGILLADAKKRAGTISRWRGVDADELVGESLARAVEYASQNPAPGPDEIWREISRGIDAQHHAERRARQPKVVKNQSSSRERLTAKAVPISELAVDDDPSTSVIAEESRGEWLWAYLHVANPESRRALAMRNDGATLDQIALAMKSGKSKARRRLDNGLKIMRAHLVE